MATAFVIALTWRLPDRGHRIYQGANPPSPRVLRTGNCFCAILFSLFPHSLFHIISTFLFSTLRLDYLPSQGLLADLVPSECCSAISIILKQHPLSAGPLPPLALRPRIARRHRPPPSPPATLETRRPSASLAPFPHIYSRSSPYLRNVVPSFPPSFFPLRPLPSPPTVFEPPHTDDDDERWQTLSVR